MTREEYRALKNMSKEQFERFLQLEHNSMYTQMLQEFERVYKEEVESSIDNFLIAIAYTIRFNEDLQMDNDKMASFMDDLFVTVDMFRTGEYHPEDYKKELDDIGVEFSPYDYSKVFRDKAQKYNDAANNVKNIVNKLMEPETEFEKGDLQAIIDALEV